MTSDKNIYDHPVLIDMGYDAKAVELFKSRIDDEFKPAIDKAVEENDADALIAALFKAAALMSHKGK